MLESVCMCVSPERWFRGLLSLHLSEHIHSSLRSMGVEGLLSLHKLTFRGNWVRVYSISVSISTQLWGNIVWKGLLLPLNCVHRQGVVVGSTPYPSEMCLRCSGG